MLYEFRRYEAFPGRLNDLHRRFQEHTLPTWERHGIDLVGLWDVEVGTNNAIPYLLRYENMADREAKWNAFISDEEWKRARKKSTEAGPLTVRGTNEFWLPAPYAPITGVETGSIHGPSTK